jgi:hypothetical protein
MIRVVGCFAIFAISVWNALSDRILHTEIAKVARTDSELDDPMIGSCPLPCDLCDLRVERSF